MMPDDFGVVPRSCGRCGAELPSELLYERFGAVVRVSGRPFRPEHVCHLSSDTPGQDS